MIVTTTLLATVMYVVWGFIFIIPLAFVIFFGLIDGVFWACMIQIFSLDSNFSNFEEVYRRCLVPIYRRYRYDFFYGILEMGDG